MLKYIDVCIVLFTLSFFPAPINIDVRTFALVESPRKRLVIKFTSAVVEPTAARELSPAKFPTTIMSAALKKSCKTLESISGSVSWRSFGKIGPLHISISCFLFAI